MNKTVWWVIGGLVVVLVIGGIVGGTLKKSKSSQQQPPSSLASGSFRAVTVPTTDRTRTVIVTPCNAPQPSADTVGSGARRTSGVTTFVLERGSGMRTVLV